jgi:hypothetical protein
VKGTLTVSDYWKRLDADGRAQINGWLEVATGVPIGESRIVSVSLGEGFIECVHYARDETGRYIVQDDEVVTYARTYPAPLPPVWPA